MKMIALICVGVALILFSGLLVNSGLADKQKSAPLLRHVVLFKFKPGTTPGQIEEIVAAFQKLPNEINLIKDFEWGTDNSPEGLAKGMTHCFFVTFASEADRDAYLPHPAHQAFVAKLKPILEDVTVVDYWAKN